MKKLMIAAAIVCAAAFAQAASINWAISGITDAPGSTSGGVAGENYYAYIFLTGDSTWTPEVAGLNEIYTLDSVLAAFKDGNYPEESFDLIGMGAVTKSGAASLALEGLDVTGAAAEKPITLTAMAVIFDSWESDPSDEDVPVWSQYQVLTKSFEFLEDGTLSATSTVDNAWVTPEPTTGLLMLVGLAGLALKRKRA